MKIKVKKGKLIFWSVLAALIIGGYFAYQAYQKKAVVDFDSEETVSEFEDAIPLKCENGEWVTFPDYSQKGNFPDYKDNARIKGTADGKFQNADGSVSFTTDQDYSLTFFTDRDVRIEGKEISSGDKKEIYVKRIKCVGAEADKSIQADRQNLMNYLSSNINMFALEKSAKSQWQISTFYFYNDTDVYVEYESKASIAGDAPYDGRLWLIRATNLDRSVPSIVTLGYIQEDENDPEKNIVKYGKDLYGEATGMTVYEYDGDAQKWVLQ